ncbi:hypothetical protein [Clostridium sp.]|uniref:hypothetical protein n=1 Tax=Clostridium sp. TaxID=1506 RepID=UPI0026DD97B1|nr:hypothetical protein [Clostridium sp.]MDO5040092.1 hypothetical protein [Clostridium sp.]
MIQKNDILYTKDLVELLGTDKQKNSYYKNCKLMPNIKRALLKKLDSIAEFEEKRVGNKKFFIIKRLLNKEESLLKNLRYSGKFSFALDKKILKFLSEIKKDNLILTNKKIIENLGLVNDIFWELQGNNLNFKIIKEKDIDAEIAKYFTGLLKYELSSLIEASLNRLNRINKLMFRKTIIVEDRDRSHREATADEYEEILGIQDKCLKKFNCKSIRGIYFKECFKEYFYAIAEAIDESILDINYFYQGYIIYNIKNDDIITIQEESILDKHLNNNIKEMIYNRCLNRRIKQIENRNVAFGDDLFIKTELKENFLFEIEKIIKYTLNN